MGCFFLFHRSPSQSLAHDRGLTAYYERVLAKQRGLAKAAAAAAAAQKMGLPSASGNGSGQGQRVAGYGGWGTVDYGMLAEALEGEEEDGGLGGDGVAAVEAKKSHR